jgi:hypothetical protein
MTKTVFTSTGTWTKPAARLPSDKGPLGFATKATVAPKPSGLVVVTRSPLVVVTR